MSAIIDLRPRLGSPEVRELVGQFVSDYPLSVREVKTEEILSEYLEHPDQPILGVGFDGELAGFIGLRLAESGHAVIRHICVRPEHRRRGLAKEMIAYACQEFFLKRLVAETDRDAVEFYRRAGFATRSLGEKYPGVERFQCVLSEHPNSRANPYSPAPKSARSGSRPRAPIPPPPRARAAK